MHTPNRIQVGDRVLILRPAYVTGKFGVVCGQESSLNGQPSKRWLIQVQVNSDAENMVVSLTPNDFQVINPARE